MSTQFRTSMDELKFSESAKAQMAERLVAQAEQIEQRTPLDFQQNVAQEVKTNVIPFKKKSHALPRLAVAAASVAALLIAGTGVAVATGIVRINPSLAAAQLFGKEAKTEIVNKIGRPIGASVSNNGMTVTADSIIGDDSCYAIVFSLSKDDGSAFDIKPNNYGQLPLGFEEDNTDLSTGLVTLEPVVYGQYGSSYFYDADPSDNSIQYVVQMATDGKLTGATMDVHLKDLTRTGEGADRTTVQKGRWDLHFKMDYENTGHNLKKASKFTYNGHAAELCSGSLSPVALSLEFTTDDRMDDFSNVPSGKAPDKMSAQQTSYLEMPIELTMVDGQVIKFKSNGGGVIDRNADKQRVKTSLWLPQIIDVNDVACVKVGDTVIPFA